MGNSSLQTLGNRWYRTVTPTRREAKKVRLAMAFCLEAVAESWFREGETQEHRGLLDLKRLEVRL